MTDRIGRVAVVGAGIAGLAAAVALHRVGVPVVVFEQAGELGEVGAGVALAPNSVRFFEELGLGDALHAIAVRTPQGMVTYAQDGRRLGSTGYTGGRSIHRRDLIDLLRSAVPGDAVRLGTKLVGVEQDADGVTLAFADGSTERADAVVGADGIHSVARRAVGDETPPTFSGVVAYRGLVPAERLPDWPIDQAMLTVGRGKHFLVFPVRAGELLNFVGFVATDEEMGESWSMPGDPAALAAEFADFNDDVRRFIAQIERTWRWGLHDHEPLERWTRGRVTLAGDAAHAMLPHAAQGANQSIEDAIALAEVLRDRPASELETALAEYETARRERASFIQQFTRRLGLLYDGHTEAFAARTDLADKETVERWIREHDARAAARAAREDGADVALPLGAPA